MAGDKMLDDLYPTVPPEIKKDRKGNLLEISLAVGQRGVTDSELAEMFHRAGMDYGKYWKEIPAGSKEGVVKCLSDLWTIDRLGLGLEQRDREAVGGVEEMRRLVSEKSESINSTFHSGNRNWLTVTTRALVMNVVDRDKPENEKTVPKGAIFEPTDEYLRRLRTVGYEYFERASDIRDANKRGSVRSYIEHERGDKLGGMRRLFNEFSQISGYLIQANPEGKGKK